MNDIYKRTHLTSTCGIGPNMLLAKVAMDIDTAIKVTRILKDVGNIVKSLDIAMKQAKAEQLETGRVKGGGTIGLYE